MKRTVIFLAALCASLQLTSLPYPADSGIINVRMAPYNAVGDGIADDTAALQQAIIDADVSGRIVYLPDGIYRVTDRLIAAEERYFLNIEGESRNGTIIRLDANAPGFGNAAQPRAVLQTVNPTMGWTNNSFMMNVVDLTIEVGAGNPGAVAILYIGNNQSSIRDVTIRTLDPDGIGHTAIDMNLISLPGPGLIRDVRTEGFECGIRIGHPQYGITLENVEIIKPRSVGIDILNTILTGRNLYIEVADAGIPAVRNADSGMAVLLDSHFVNTGSGNGIAVQSSGYLYLCNLTETGFGTLLSSLDQTVVALDGEFISHPAVSLFPSEVRSLYLPIEEVPEVFRDHPDNWINVADFGAQPGTDSTAAIRAAIAAATPERGTLYFPNTSHQIYWISDTIEVGGHVQRIVGMNARINANATLRAMEKPMFKLVDGSADWLVIEQFFIPWGTAGAHTQFANERSKGTLLQYIFSTMDQFYDGRKGSGTTHFVDITAGHAQNDIGPAPLFHFGPDERIWARQLNPEINDGHITNEGGDVWIFGFKTEREGPIIVNRHGGQMEVIGAMIHPRNIGVPADMQVIINDQADISFIGREANSNNAFYTVLAEVWRGDEFARLLFDDPSVTRINESGNRAFVFPLFVERGASASPVRGASATRRFSSSQINLQWEAVQGALSYRILRGTMADGSDRMVIATSDDTNFFDTHLPVGSTFWYWIDPIAIDGTRMGISSGFNGRTSPGLAQPPDNVSATYGTFAAHIDIEWDKVQGASFYFLWRNSVDDLSSATRIVTISDNAITFFRDNNVEPGQNYYYWIQPFTVGFGQGPASAPAALGRAGALPNSWANYPFLPNGNWVDTGNFMGIIHIAPPFIWNAHLQSWLYLPESMVTETGSWSFIYR